MKLEDRDVSPLTVPELDALIEGIERYQVGGGDLTMDWRSPEGNHP